MSTGVMARQSTAVTLDVGPILDSTGAEYASAVIADLTISKNGTRAAMSGNTFNYASNGMYSLTLTTGNTDTLGVIQISCNKATYQMRVVERQVVPANVYDSVVLGSDYLQIDAVQFGGTNGTFSGGKPDVGSATSVSGSVGSVTGAVGSVTGSVGSVVGNVGGSVASVAGAVGSVTGNVGGDVSGKVLGGGSGTISGDGVRAASVTGAVGSVTGSVGSVVGAVGLDSASITSVQSGLALEATSQSIKSKTDNLPSDPADQSLIIAATDAVMARLGAPTGASVSADVAAVKSDTASLLSRLTANAATAIQNLFHMITGTGASSKYTVAALENAPASGGGGDAEQDTLLEVQTTVNALALSLAGTSVTVTSRVSGSEITAYIGDDYKVRSGTELEITVSDTGGALHTKLAAIGTSNLYFGASLPRKDPGQITGTISSLSYASNVLTIAVEITACASGLTTGDYTYQIQSSQAQGGDFDDFVELEGTLVVKQRTVAVRG